MLFLPSPKSPKVDFIYVTLPYMTPTILVPVIVKGK